MKTRIIETKTYIQNNPKQAIGDQSSRKPTQARAKSPSARARAKHLSTSAGAKRVLVAILVMVLGAVLFLGACAKAPAENKSESKFQDIAKNLDKSLKQIKSIAEIGHMEPSWLAMLDSPTTYELKEGYKPPSKLIWEEINESALSQLDGLDYWENLPELAYGQCTGYVGWVMVYIYGIQDYPHEVSTIDNRNAGEWVCSQRLWLMENAQFVGAATTETGEIKYHGERYQPGDIIVFNCTPDDSQGKLYSLPTYDYWGEEDVPYYTHIGIVGSDPTKWEEDFSDLDEPAKQAGTLPVGQYNMHHDIESHGGIVNMLSPEQFIMRNYDDGQSMDFSRSYEIYRVLSSESRNG